MAIWSAARELSPEKKGNILVKAVCALVGVGIVLWELTHPLVNPHIPSEPYVWPARCLPKGAKNSGEENVYYGIFSKIPKYCFTRKYYFPDAGKYNFPTSMGVGRNYYRIGRDALNIECRYGEEFCTSVNIVEDVFVTPGSKP